MIDWATIKPLAMATIATLSDVHVAWEDEAQASVWSPMPIIYLRISALGQVGIPYELRGDNVSGDQTVTVASQKRFTLSLRCESFNQDLASGEHAGDIVETIKTRLKRSSTIERLRGIFCVQTVLGSNRFSYTSQGRDVDCYTLDLLCATADNDVDHSDEAGGFVDEVVVTSNKVYGPDGVQTKTQVNLDIT